jgi:hypothetical protein
MLIHLMKTAIFTGNPADSNPSKRLARDWRAAAMTRLRWSLAHYRGTQVPMVTPCAS